MAKQKDQDTRRYKANLKLFGLVIFVLGIAFYGGSIFSKHRKGLPPKLEGQSLRSTEGQPSPSRHSRSPDEMKQRINELMTELNFTDKQRVKMGKLMKQKPPKTTGGRRQRFEAMRKIATPEQEEKFFRIILQRVGQRMEHSRKTLSSEDFSTLKRRVEGRFQRFLNKDRPEQ